MLCPNCTQYTWRSVAGTCQHCSGATPNYYNRLCAQCSTNLDECEICRTNMGTKSSSCTGTGNPTAWTVKKKLKDNGGSVTLKVGDELEVTLDETSAKEWYTGYNHNSSYIDETQRGTLTAGQTYGTGYRTITFKAKSPGKTTLIIEEWQMRYSYSGWGYSSSYVKDKKTGTTWTITVTVK